MSWEEPRIEPTGQTSQGFVHIEKSSVKFTRNAKGDTQIELRVVEGTTPEEMQAIRELAYENYKRAVEDTGGLIA